MSRSITSMKYAALGVAGAIALAGCGAGQITQTSTQLSGVDGASGNVGQIAVRDTSFVYEKSDTAAVHPAGGDAPLQGSIVNFGATDDKLVSASSPVARSVQVEGSPTVASGRSLIITGQAPAATSAAATTPATGSAGPTSRSGSSATASASASATPIPVPTTPAEPAGTTTTSIVLVGLTQDLRSGLTYPVTFRFQNAGQVTVQVPVANSDAPRTASAGE